MILGDTSKPNFAVRRPLAIAWTRVCRELGRALYEHERLGDVDPPPGLPSGNNLPELTEALHEMMAYRDVLRDWADLPPGDNDAAQGELTKKQAEMTALLNDMEDELNKKGHSMNERECSCDYMPDGKLCLSCFKAMERSQ